MRGSYAAKTVRKFRKAASVAYSASDSSSRVGTGEVRGGRDILDEEAQQKALSEEERLDRMPGYLQKPVSLYTSIKHVTPLA